MKIAFLADPLSTFKTYKDTTYAMMVEAARRGHELYAFRHRDMAIESGRVKLQGHGATVYLAPR